MRVVFAALLDLLHSRASLQLEMFALFANGVKTLIWLANLEFRPEANLVVGSTEATPRALVRIWNAAVIRGLAVVERINMITLPWRLARFLAWLPTDFSLRTA